jgi:hypothetical protein
MLYNSWVACLCETAHPSGLHTAFGHYLSSCSTSSDWLSFVARFRSALPARPTRKVQAKDNRLPKDLAFVSCMQPAARLPGNLKPLRVTFGPLPGTCRRRCCSSGLTLRLRNAAARQPALDNTGNGFPESFPPLHFSLESFAETRCWRCCTSVCCRCDASGRVLRRASQRLYAAQETVPR